MEQFKPSLTGLNQLETSVLMEKYVILLGMINYGTPEQKKQARDEFNAIEGLIHQHVNGIAFETAASKLDFSEEEMEILNHVQL